MPNDYALVVGIDRYPLLNSLGGAQRDAANFGKWLTASDGGNVPPANVKLLLSDGFATASDDFFTQPLMQDVYGWLAAINAAAKRRAKSEPRFGRRLYLYFAGHGFAPQEWDEACLFMANASPDTLGEHVPGIRLAQFFVATGHFDEVVLFMDCCREKMLSAPLRGIPWSLPSGAPPARDFYALAAPYGKVSREKALPPDNLVSGVFTTSLLEGLRGKAADADGNVTDRSLTSYVYQAMKEKLGDDYLEPRLRPNSVADIVFVQGVKPADSTTAVTITLSNALGQEAVLRDGFLVEKARHAMDGSVWTIRLPRGLYLLESGERRTSFVVQGETANAQL